VFDESREEFAEVRDRLDELLDDGARRAARETVLNAHYTDPAYAQAMWDALEGLGWTPAAGPVLEPGCGSGIFIATAPHGTRVTGVEVDPTTAAIAQALNPDADVRAESFADSVFAGRFAAVIGNVPFGDYALFDPVDNPERSLSIHNHFVIKSLANVAPGGVVALISSRYLLDAKNPAAREQIAGLADLIGAVRLPGGAHRRVAGTDVVTDVLLLQRHAEGYTPQGEPAWVGTVDVDVDGDQVAVNRYFAEYPGRVLGTYGYEPFPGPGLAVRASGSLDELPARLAEQLEAIVEEARGRGMRVPATLDLGPRRVAAPRATRARERWDGHLAVDGDGFTIQQPGAAAPREVPKTARAELRALLGLRDLARSVLEQEAASAADTEELAAQRTALASAYEAYVERYGPINRFKTSTSTRVDPETGQETQRVTRRAPTAVRILREDPFGPLVMALEIFDDAEQTAEPARLLRERVIEPPQPVLATEDPDEAIAISLDRHGRVEPQAIAELLGRSESDALAMLGDRVFDDPDAGRWVTAAEYLSGNVRARLESVQALVEERPELARNVEALRAVMPQDIGIDEIQARFGAVWIDAATHEAFLREILDDPTVQIEHPAATVWAVRGRTATVAASSQWGTQRRSAIKLAELLAQQKPVLVYDTDSEGVRTFNAVETAAAQDKAAQIQERFGEWVWEDLDRARRLVSEYNRRFNSIVLRDYAAAGERLTLPGLVRTFEPRPHQRAAVARMLGEPAVGLFHEVGAGKTAEMVIGATELRRLGMVRKPCVIVPNHMLEQFSREWLQLYPRARLLAASSADLSKDARRAFIARAATHDWDAIVMTHSAFEKIALSPQSEAAFMQRELDSQERQLKAASANTTQGLTVKRLEKALQSRREKLKELASRDVDPGLTFEATGIDYVLVDEAHLFKNLSTVSAIPGASIEGSKRASDLAAKLDYLRGRRGERVGTFATATPIANSMTEAHVMMRLLRPDLLEEAGVSEFDAWAATFGQTATQIEVSADGSSFHQKTRFSSFINVPEMMRIWHTFGDVKTAEDLDLPRPDLLPGPDGKPGPQTIVVEPSARTAEYISSLADRADAVRGGGVDPREDNILKISGDGRKAALDMRLIDGATEYSEQRVGKLEVAAAQIASIWADHREAEYVDPQSGAVSPRRGALQIVFCDLGTPRQGWNVYDELRDLLAGRGIPAEQVRFVHDAKSDADKARLFAACRSGEVAVLLGSTAKMGVGTNIQSRAIALHHLDCPWRPADIQQRDGRILRQGNQHDAVAINRYVVEGSFDAFMWQAVAWKSRMINQVMRGDPSIRTVEDLGEDSLSYDQIKALASGNPLLLDKAKADAELQRLTRLERSHRQQASLLRATHAQALQDELAFKRTAKALEQAQARAIPTRGDAFEITIDGQRHTKRTDAAARLSAAVHDAMRGLRGGVGPLGVVAELGGFSITARARDYDRFGRAVAFTPEGLPLDPTEVEIDDGRVDGARVLRSLEAKIAGIPDARDRALNNAAAHRRVAENAAEQLQRPFKHADALVVARKRVADLNQQLAEASRDRAEPHDDADHQELRRLRSAMRPEPRAQGRPPSSPIPAARNHDARRDGQDPGWER
jgi:N12 class adenine-specific DNA methylase